MKTFAQILFFILLSPIVGLGFIVGVIYTSLRVGFQAFRVSAIKFLDD